MLTGLLGPEQQQSGRVGFEDYANGRMPGCPIPVHPAHLIFAQVADKNRRVLTPKLRPVQEGEEFFPRGVTDIEVGGRAFPADTRPFCPEPSGHVALRVACLGTAGGCIVYQGEEEPLLGREFFETPLVEAFVQEAVHKGRVDPVPVVGPDPETPFFQCSR